MAAYDLEEQEQLATLKAWWAENGNLVMTTLSLVLVVLAAWQGWNYYQRNQAAQASAAYDSVQKAARAGDLKQVRESAGAILERYPRTTYAAMAALVVVPALPGSEHEQHQAHGGQHQIAVFRPPCLQRCELFLFFQIVCSHW